MKFMLSQKYYRAYSCLCLLFMTACGNPHLIGQDGSGLSIRKTAPKKAPTSSATATATATATASATATATTTATATPTPVVVENSLKVTLTIDNALVENFNFPVTMVSEQPSVWVKIQNDGNVVATLKDLKINSDLFTLMDEQKCLSVLPIQGTCVVKLQFSAKKVGAFSDQLVLKYENSSHQLAQDLSLTVTGQKTKYIPAGKFNVTWKFQDLSNADNQVDFGKSRTLDPVAVYGKVTNNGDLPALLNSSTIDHNNGFAVVDINQCLDTLQPAASCQFKIVFRSEQPGNFNSNLKLSYQDATQTYAQDLVIQLSGQKIVSDRAPVLKLSEFDADALDFGKVDLGSKYSKLLEIKNSNDENLVLSLDEILLNSANGFSFSGGTFPGTHGTCQRLMKAGSCLVEITFAPTKIGIVSGKFSLIKEGQKLLDETLNGEGVQPAANSPCEHRRDQLLFAEGDFDVNDASIIYPYNQTAPGSKHKISRLYGLATNNRYSCQNCESVLDANVLTRFSLKALPPEEELVSSFLQLHIGKIHHTRQNFGTEMICLQNSLVRTCSGRTYDPITEAFWYKHLNKKFFDAQHAAPKNAFYNDYLFEDGNVTQTVDAQGQNIDKIVLKSNLSFAQLFEIDAQSTKNILRDSYLNVILVDDVKNLNYPRILLTFKKEITCEVAN